MTYINKQILNESGVAGADRVKSRQDFQQFLKSYKDLISQFPGFVGFNPSGSYNSDMAKNDFGDIDIIVHIKSDKDKATVKKELQAFLQRQPETVIVPFSSAKHAGKRSYNAGELVSVRYHDDSLGYSAQIDNIVALDQTEATFKQLFLDWPAEKQGLILGLVKIATIETDPAVLFKKLGINAQPNIEQNQEYEFNLSSVELQLRLATYDPELLAQGQYKQLSRDVVWSTRNFEDIQKLLYQYDLDANFDQLLAKSKQVIKNPRSNARMQGVFGSMITVKSGEVGTAKGAGKEAALDKIKQTFGESRGLLRALIETSAPSTVVFAFGRLQPPTIGHELLVNVVKQTAEQNHCPYVIYVSRTVGKTPAEKLKNPLTVDQKMGYLSRMFPGTNFQPATDAVRTPVEAAKHLNQKYRNLIMIAGGSRAEEFEKLLNDYNGKDYNFDSIRVVKIERDPDADDATGMSGTKMRQAAAADDFATFKSGVPGALDDASAQQLMADVKAGMTPTPKIKKIKEDTSPAMKRTAKDLENPPKVMQHRAKRDQEREQQYKNAQLRRDHEDDDIDEIFGLKTKPEAPKPKKLTPDDYAELMKMSKQQNPVGSTGNKKVYHNPDEFDWDKKHGLAEANSLEGTVKTITDHGKYIAQVFEQLKAMAKRYVDGRGDLKGFAMVAGGVGSRWFNDFYFNKLQAELYALTKQAPKYSQALIYFLKDASEDREHKISFNEISKQLPTILFNMGHKMKSGALTQFADNWGNRYHEYKNYLTKIEVEAGYDDDEFDEPKVKAPKSNAIGKQNTQVDQIINSVLAKLPKNVAGDVRNAIARSDNKLQALHQELQKRDIQGVAEGQENYNGIDISMEIQKDDEYVDDEDYDNQVLYVTASSKGKELGHVLFAFDGEYLMPQDLEVEERYRGQGIAQTMYDYVKSKGYKIRRSGQQTDAGAGFWDKHKGPGQNVWEQGVAEGLNEFAPGGQEGNGPFDYGSAIVQIGEDYTELYNDDGDGADAARIIKVGKTFMDAGMTAGINAFYAMDTMVRDHVAEQLQDLGFNVRQDIYLPYRQGIAKKTADSNAKYATHQATPAGQEEARNKAVIKAVIVSGSKNYQPGHEVASLIFDKRKQDVAQRLAEIKKEMSERFGPMVKIDYQVTIGGNPVQVKEQGVAEAATPSNKLFVKKLTSEQELIEHAKQFAKNLVQEGVPITSKNRYTVVCSTIFAQTRKSLTESKHIIGGKQVIELLKRLDQFPKLSVKVGSKVAIINSQLQGDSIELWGFTTPKTITKIYRDPSDKSIKQFEFNNDPDDVWPRTENAEYNGQFLMYSAFFDDKKSAEHALTMLTLQTSGDLIIRNHIAEKGVAEGPYTNKKESFDGGSYAANKKGFAGQGRYTDMTRNDQGYNIGENWELAKAEAIARLIESQLK